MKRSIDSKVLSGFQRAVCLWMIVLLSSMPASARAPGRAGIADLVDVPDEMAPARANIPRNIVQSAEQLIAVPNGPAGAGSVLSQFEGTDISVSQDAVAGAPDGMALGSAYFAASGELVVPLRGAGSNGWVNGKPAVPGVAAVLGRVELIPPLQSLKSVAVPPVPGLEAFVQDRRLAIALGKALFWDSKVGSDGLACASCHFAAGADNRMKNQLSPGLLAGDHTFSRNLPRAGMKAVERAINKYQESHILKRTATGGGGPNYTLKPEDFPFYRLADPQDRNSSVVFESNDVVSSQGTFAGTFNGVRAKGAENCANRQLDEFNVHGTLTRRVEPRNSPTVINSAYYHRNFWDGRANNVFNGVNPFGDRDPDARVLDLREDGSVAKVRVALPNASLASQAVGPALSDFEMSCSGKTFKDLARKLLSQRALMSQKVHSEDSVLGPYVGAGGVGLQQTYTELIKKAFHPRWWKASGDFEGHSQIESNFSLFWGLAIMLYEATLISDEAPIDKFLGWSGTAPDLKALGEKELRGLKLFRGKAMCVSCHRGPEFTSAGTYLQRSLETNLTEQMFVGAGQIGLYDNGFYNIGVRPTGEDLGVGGEDPFGNPLSYSRQFLGRLQGKPLSDQLQVTPCLFALRTDASECWTLPDPTLTRTGVDGAFKTPTLRNVALTQPYFHNGSRYTLEQVVEFYNRGGDRRGPDGNDTTGFSSAFATGGGASNIHPNIRPLKLTALERADLVAFLRNSLTDTRVACKRAPFDHPSLLLINGHSGNTRRVEIDRAKGVARDDLLVLEAVGAKGVGPDECLVDDKGQRPKKDR